MATNIQINILNSNNEYELLYPETNFDSIKGILSVTSGGTGVTSYADLKTNLNLRTGLMNVANFYTGNASSTQKIQIPQGYGMFIGALVANSNTASPTVSDVMGLTYFDATDFTYKLGDTQYLWKSGSYVTYNYDNTLTVSGFLNDNGKEYTYVTIYLKIL